MGADQVVRVGGEIVVHPVAVSELRDRDEGVEDTDDERGHRGKGKRAGGSRGGNRAASGREKPMTDVLVVIDEVVADPAVEELLAHAEESLTGVVLVTAAYFKEKNMPFDDLISFAGSSLAPSWDEVK